MFLHLWYSFIGFFLESEVIALDAVGLGFGPFQFLDGKTKADKVWDVFGLQVLTKFLLNGSSGPQVLATVNASGLKEL